MPVPYEKRKEYYKEYYLSNKDLIAEKQKDRFKPSKYCTYCKYSVYEVNYIKHLRTKRHLNSVLASKN